MKDVSKLLRDNRFRYKKQFGQNFITDTNLLYAIAADAGVTEEDTVIEVGLGAGTLTACLAEKAKKVIGFEIDNTLKDILGETLSGISNAELFFEDILKVEDSRIAGLVNGPYKVVANLPYYITAPVIMKFIESQSPPQSLTVMLQKEVAERLTAKAGTPEYGVFTLVTSLYCDAEITRAVGRKMFYPVPEVDSAVIKLTAHDRYEHEDVPSVKKLIKAAFSMRRKTLVNNLTSNFNTDKKKLLSALDAMGLDERIRGEALTLEQFIGLRKLLA